MENELKNISGMKLINYNFFLRMDQISSSGMAPIYIVLTENKRKKYFSTKIFVSPKHWDPKKKQVKKGDIRHSYYNKLLLQYEDKIFNHIFNAEITGSNISIESVCSLLSHGAKGISVYKFIEQTIEKNEDGFAESTLVRYKTLTNKLKTFRNELYFSDITPSFIGEYKHYLSAKKKNSENTISSTLSFLKGIISKARKKGLTNIHPFDGIRIKSIVGNKVDLLMSEVNRLENLFYSEDIDSRYKNVLGYFLFACFTGLRYSDVSKLKMKDIQHSMINTLTQKTKVWIKVPLSNRAKSLLQEPYKDFVFRVISNQKTNEYLKEIAKIAKINKRITFHTARHTFATRCMELDIPIYVISKFLGHTNIRTTEIYLHDCCERQKIEEINKWDNNY